MQREDIVKLCRTFSSSAYGEDELEEFAKALLAYVPAGSTVVEIGCQYGSSTAAILTVSQELNYRVWCIDPFILGGEVDVGPKFLRRMVTFDTDFALLVMKSSAALQFVPAEFDAVHIDGDHTKEGVEFDCAAYLPRLKHGGVAICHDYGRCGAPDVQPTFDAHTSGWNVIYSGGVRIVQKP